jgi:predicted nucleic acid-binding protein
VESAPAPAEPAEPVTGDPADDLILASAVKANVDVLVSGDRKHLLPVVTHRGVRIVTPQALLAEP